MIESLEAKGQIDALGSLSDDEGTESEEEEEEEEEEGDVSANGRLKEETADILETEERKSSSPAHPSQEPQPVSHLVEVAASS